MLTELSIKNVAIIDTLNIPFQSGLTVLTGETGAGKSIIIDAVGLIMGGRASAELIRSGEDEAVVEALFDLSNLAELKEFLAESGFDCDGELLVKRLISRGGKNRIFINGSMATQSLLTDISRRLINIYGQHESQTLLKPDNQLLLLDAFAETMLLREEFAQFHQKLQATRERLLHLDEEEREVARRLDLLSYQSEEIAASALKPGEDTDLEEQRTLLANAGKLGSASALAFERLYDGNNALLGDLRRINASVNEIAGIDYALHEIALSLENAYLQLEDAAISLRDYSSKIETDPVSLQEIDDRLDLIGKMKKKYGTTIEDILAYKDRIDIELEALRARELDKSKLEEEAVRLQNSLQSCGGELTARRSKACAELKQALESEIHQLAMKNAIIEPALIPLAEPRSSGMEKVEFLFAPNPGEAPRPLAKIASGGELSRLMLAIKQVLPEGAVPTLIFDEVDTGIGGGTSELVGRKLKRVAERHQVFCITHLPQVAVFADQHLRVEKQVGSGRTSTIVAALDMDSRTEEISRMLGGAKITATTRQHAAELLASARNPHCPQLDLG